MKVRLTTLALGALFLSMIASCSTFERVAPGTTTVAHTYLLVRELTVVKSTLDAVDFDPAERTVVDEGLRIASEVVDQFDDMSTTDALITVLKARDIVDRTSAAYGMVRDTYVAYLERTGQAPDNRLLTYDQSAKAAYLGVIEMLDRYDQSATGINPSELATYTGLVLRILAAR